MSYDTFFSRLFRYRVLNHIMYWLVIILFFTVSPLGYNIGFGMALLMEVVYFPASVLLTYGILYLAIPRFLLKNKYLLFVLYLILTYTLDFFSFLLVKYHVTPFFGIPTDNNSMLVDFFWCTLTFTFGAGVIVAIKITRYNFQLRKEQAEMTKQKLESEMNLLRSKVNPHFLFNTLNNIDEMMYNDRDKASNYIYLLSEIMRYMLTFADKEESFLKDEIAYIRNYFELMKNSLPSQNFIKFKVEGEIKQQKVPTLIFLPIVENAIKHCRKNIQDNLEIHFTIGKDSIKLDSSNYIRKTYQPLEEKNGFGLQNLKKRLKLIYGNNYDFSYQINDSVFSSHLKILFL